MDLIQQSVTTIVRAAKFVPLTSCSFACACLIVLLLTFAAGIVTLGVEEGTNNERSWLCVGVDFFSFSSCGAMDPAEVCARHADACACWPWSESVAHSNTIVLPFMGIDTLIRTFELERQPIKATIGHNMATLAINAPSRKDCKTDSILLCSRRNGVGHCPSRLPQDFPSNRMMSLFSPFCMTFAVVLVLVVVAIVVAVIHVVVAVKSNTLTRSPECKTPSSPLSEL